MKSGEGSFLTSFIARFAIITDTGDPIAVPGRIPTAHFITTVETAINRSGVIDNMTAKARMKVICAVNCVKIPPRNIPQQELKAWKELASDEDTLVLPVDKGRPRW